LGRDRADSICLLWGRGGAGGYLDTATHPLMRDDGDPDLASRLLTSQVPQPSVLVPQPLSVCAAESPPCTPNPHQRNEREAREREEALREECAVLGGRLSESAAALRESQDEAAAVT